MKDRSMQSIQNNVDKNMFPILATISISFFLAIVVSFYSVTRLARENTKEIDTMLTYRIYDSIASSLNEPITVAKTMACDHFLVDFLENEAQMEEADAIDRMRNYLNHMKSGLEYDSAFLVSETSRRYYTYEGLNKIVDPVNDAHDVWYSLFIEKNKPYDLDVDSDEMNHGVWTVFVNARLEDDHGKLLGVCGVGVKMNYIQGLFRTAEKEYGVKINLVAPDGLVQVDTQDINIENAWLDEPILSAKDTDEYTYQTLSNQEFVVTKYVEYLGWYLVIRSAPTSISREFISIIIVNIVLFLLVMVILILMISVILKRTKKERDAREKLLIMSERAVAASEAKSSFLSSMSHEIRTPINTVLGMNEMILRESRDDAIVEYSANIRSAGQTLLALINSILDFSKIEEGKMEIIPVKYDTTSVINNLVASISERAKSKGLEFIGDADPNLPARMVGDDVRLSQVIMNLLTNAVKYTEAGQVRFSIHGGERKDGQIELKVAVADTGIGIRQEDMSRLFESFERLDTVRNHNIEGTGLGMSIVTKLLEMMGSRLEVESTYGKGSTFSFTVLQKVADDTPIGDYSHRLAISRDSIGQEKLIAPDARILVVDDNDMNLKVAKNLLKLFGIAPDLAISGFEAIQRLRTGHYHIVFLDHMMPKMDGIETLMRIRDEGLLPPETRVIVLTANAINGAKEQYLAQGFDDYLSKPIDVSKLEHQLARYLPKEICHTRDEEAPAPAPEPAAVQGRAGDPLAALEAAGFDTQAALRYAAGDREFYLELVRSFVGSHPKNRAAIQEDREKRDFADYEIRVHALKSTSRQIGANALSDQALEQELAAKAGDEGAIDAGAAPLLQGYDDTVSALRRALGLTDTPDPTPAPAPADQKITAEALQAALSEVAALIDSFETETALEKLRPLSDLRCGSLPLSAPIGEITAALDEFDTETAAERLKALREQITEQ